jgi:hypothetical protein
MKTNQLRLNSKIIAVGLSKTTILYGHHVELLMWNLVVHEGTIRLWRIIVSNKSAASHLHYSINLLTTEIQCCGPGSVDGIATAYGLDGPEIESRWGRDFPHLSRPTLSPTQPPVKWVPGLCRG